MWKPEDFEVAWGSGAGAVAGYTYRGLGLHVAINPSPKGKRPTRWTLTHLNTGHRIGYLDGDVRTAFPVATDIAEAGDWDFLSFEGWKDRFPDAKERLAEIQERHPKVFTWKQGDGGGNNREIAQQIASNRP